MEQEMNNEFSLYPIAMDSYFLENDIAIKLMPDEYVKDGERHLEDRKITSVEQYISFIESEIEFWKKNGFDGKSTDLTKLGMLKSAKTYFENALKYYQEDNLLQGKDHLSRSISYLSSGIVYSKTGLAKLIVANSEKDSNFFGSLRLGILKNVTNNISTSVASLEGFNVALAYKKLTKKVADSLKKADLESYKSNYEESENKYAELNERYLQSFRSQEKQISELTTRTDEKITELDNRAEEMFRVRSDYMDELEKTYSQKLMLSAPADYWKTLENDYLKKGKTWLVISGLCAAGVIGVLLLTVYLFPSMFSDEMHWLDAFKNSAIITIIASIAIYVLRVLVKIAMSSFHLARDAKEREQLSYFYLALIQENGVTDNERAIILNALFSRADTGLLKGDSGPAMSGDIVSLMAKYNNPNGK